MAINPLAGQPAPPEMLINTEQLIADYFEKRPDRADKSQVGSSRVDLQACKLEYSIVSPK